LTQEVFDMLEIIDDVLKAEQDAEALITQAKERSQELQAALEKEERTREQAARTEQNKRVAEEVARIRKEAEDSGKLRQAELREHADQFLRDRQSDLKDAAEAVGRLVLESGLILNW
jgi:vacuolar-type H+-ATPase subunit H